MLLVHNGWLITMDPGLGDIQHGSVLIDGARIVEVGPDIQVPDDCEVIDATGMIVIPGLIDAHRHLWQTALRGIIADSTLSDYFQTVRRQYLARYRPEDARLGTYAGALESIAGGTTAILDHSHGVVSPDHADALVDAMVSSGVRGTWAYGYCPVETSGKPAFSNHDQRIADASRIRSTYFSSDDGGLLRMGVAATEQGLVSSELTAKEIRSARDMDVRWTLHSQCPPGNSPITRGFHALYAEGFLDDRAVLSHCNDFGVDDFSILADAGAHFVSSPDPELSLGIARPPAYVQALRAGVQPSLGTDCVVCMSADMFGCMRMALTVARHLFNSGPGHTFEELTTQSILTRDVFRWATVEGAAALGLGDQIGSLTPGKLADVVLVDARSLNLAPILEPVADLVLHAHAGNVSTVLINGVIRKRDGVMLGVDLPRVYEQLAQSRDYLLDGHPYAPPKNSEREGSAEWAARLSHLS